MVDFHTLAFEHAPVGLVLSENRIIRCCNVKFASLLGYTRTEIEGQSFRMFYGSDEEFENIRDVGIDVLKANGDYSDERLFRRRDGASVWCRFRAHSLTPETPLRRIILSYAPIAQTPSTAHLSKRERQVLGLMSQSKTSKEIARELGLSPRTIDDVRARLIKRYGVKRCVDLLRRMKGFG